MKKLLHERLRGWEGFHHFALRNGNKIFLSSSEAQSIADEIERDYFSKKQYECEIEEIKATAAGDLLRRWAEKHKIPFGEDDNISGWLDRWFIPRPRFEDGEPIKVGDEVYYDENRDATVESYTVTNDGRYEIWTNQIADIEGCVHDPVKRPSPKALDVDGVEIKEGDTLWDVTTGNRYEVTTLSDKQPFIFLSNGDYQFGTYAPGRLTHKEPDSLEKLLETINEIADQDNDFRPIAHRLSVLIDRGANCEQKL